MSTPFTETFVAGIVAHLNEEHRRELLDLAHGLAGQLWATEAEALTLAPTGLGLLLWNAERAEELPIPFEPPLERPNQVRPALIALIGRARAQLGRSEQDDHDDDGERNLGLRPTLYRYLLDVSLREPDVLRRLREATAELDEGDMQIGPEQGQFLALLLKLLGARRVLEVGTFTGYSALWMALALPDDGQLLACDVSAEWTGVGRRFWQEAGVAHKIDLRLAPAAETLAALLADGQAGQFDFAFIDADKEGYDGYYEQCVELVRPGGLIAIDNVLWGGAVADPEADDEATVALRALNTKLHADEQVDLSLLPIGDGLTLVRKRSNSNATE
jgi:caffeoyl-CoA O-methyltransferase